MPRALLLTIQLNQLPSALLSTPRVIGVGIIISCVDVGVGVGARALLCDEVLGGNISCRMQEGKMKSNQ